MVVDVRTKFEWDRGHYKGAKHIPVTSLKESKFKGVPKGTGILVYCNTGQRARSAADTIRGYGFENVFYIEGGYWTLN
jgi:rhodanese-related sulfurtransferase